MIIIGVSAKKQGGKSTLIDAMVSQLPEGYCEIIRFADTLKQIVIDCFIPPEMNLKKPDDLDSDEVKNTMLPCGKTIRQMLQTIGTDWFRHTWDDCWINTFKNRIRKSKASFILVPDCRFPNELKAIQEMGGVVIRLMRAPFGDQDQHESETALDAIERSTCEASLIPNFTVRRTGQDNLVMRPSTISAAGPGTFFNIVYDNRYMTLTDAEVWAKNFVEDCFSWGGNSEGIINPEFDLRKLGNKNASKS